MSYQKINFVNGQTLTAEQLNHLQKGIIDLENTVVQVDWNQTDETAKDFIKNKPNEKDAVAILAEMLFVTPVANADGSVFTDGNGKVYTL